MMMMMMIPMRWIWLHQFCWDFLEAPLAHSMIWCTSRPAKPVVVISNPWNGVRVQSTLLREHTGEISNQHVRIAKQMQMLKS